MHFEIKILQPGDLEKFKQLLTVFDVVFEYEAYKRPADEYLQQLLKNKGFQAVVAITENKVIAGLTAYVLAQYHSMKPILYIQDLAVLQEYQRKKAGSKLIAFTKEYCMQNNFELMFIQAEKVDDYAVQFYRSTNPTEEVEVAYFSYDTGIK